MSRATTPTGGAESHRVFSFGVINMQLWRGTSAHTGSLWTAATTNMLLNVMRVKDEDGGTHTHTRVSHRNR